MTWTNVRLIVHVVFCFLSTRCSDIVHVGVIHRLTFMTLVVLHGLIPVISSAIVYLYGGVTLLRNTVQLCKVYYCYVGRAVVAYSFERRG
jgi:hypothetical protein